MNGLRSIWPWPLMWCYVSLSFTSSCQLSPTLPHAPLSAFFFITLTSPPLQLLSVFLLHFLMLLSLTRWVLFIYGHALSVCVGLSNIHLSCAATIQILIPSHMRGMKHENWNLRSLSLNTPNSKWREMSILCYQPQRGHFSFLLHLLCFFPTVIFFYFCPFILLVFFFLSLVQSCRAGCRCRS